MKRNLLGLIIILSSFLFTGCGKVETNNKNNQEKIKEGIVEESGKITTKLGDEYLLSTKSGIINLTSTKINLDDYLKKEVTVKGMFSGSTLYVDEIK